MVTYINQESITEVYCQMKNYVTLSLETNLFFARIMREHALFLLAGFPASETEYRKRADWFREQFEDLLRSTVALAEGMVSEEVLSSGEVVTEFTEMAEQQTKKLAGVSIDVRITQAEKQLRAGCPANINRAVVIQVRRLNQSVLWLLNELIAFKEKILREVAGCQLFTVNYPLLIEHILREAKLYRQILSELERNGCITSQNLKATEIFWNQIMMEHAQFIRGLLDPTECELMESANGFAKDFCRLLETAKEQDCRTMDDLTRKTLETTEKYRDFKAAGTDGLQKPFDYFAAAGGSCAA